MSLVARARVPRGAWLSLATSESMAMLVCVCEENGGMWGERVRLLVSLEASEERPWALEET